MFHYRQLKWLKRKHPKSILHMVQHRQDIELTATLAASEGIIDSFSVLSEDASADADALVKFLNFEFPHIAFDRILLGWCYSPNLDEVFPRVPAFQKFKHIYVTSGGECHEWYKEKTHLPPLKTIEYNEEAKGYWDAWTIEEAVDGLWKKLDPDKPTLCIHPLSTRSHAAMQPEAVELIGETFSNDFNLVCLGLYTASLREKASKEMFQALNDLGYFNWMGLNPLKQREVMLRSRASIMTPTGALVWPLLDKNITMICIQGGQWSVGHWLQFAPNFLTVESGCTRFPCDNNESSQMRYKKCEDKPLCLAKDLNIEGLKSLVYSL